MFHKDTPSGNPSQKSPETPPMQSVDYIAPAQAAQAGRVEAPPAMPSVPASEQAAGGAVAYPVAPQPEIDVKHIGKSKQPIPKTGFSNIKVEATSPTVAAEAPPAMPGLPPEALEGFEAAKGIKYTPNGASTIAPKGQSGTREL